VLFFNEFPNNYIFYYKIIEQDASHACNQKIKKVLPFIFLSDIRFYALFFLFESLILRYTHGN